MHRFSRALQSRQFQHFRPPRRIGQFRTGSQYVYQNGGDRLRYQNVRFVSPRSGLRTVGGVIVTAIALSVLTRFALRGVLIEILPDEDVADQKRESLQGGMTDEELEDDDPLFIPLTWSTQLPRTFYKGSDPEWQQFIKYAKDSDLRKRVQDELVKTIFKFGSQHPSLQQRLGSELKIGKVWLETAFPEGPPPEYERMGIAVGNGYVAIASQTISDEENWQWMRRMWPSAVSESTFSAMKVMLGMQYRRFKQALGLEGVDPTSPEEKYKRAVALIEQRNEQMSKSMGGTQTDPSKSTSAVVGGAAGASSQRPVSGDADRRFPGHVPMSTPGSPDGQSSIESSVMFHTFYGELRKKWLPKQFEPPRGTLIIHGLIEIIGSRGRLILDVSSCYDPSANKHVNVTARQRSYKRKAQSPRGGP